MKTDFVIPTQFLFISTVVFSFGFFRYSDKAVHTKCALTILWIRN